MPRPRGPPVLQVPAVGQLSVWKLRFRGSPRTCRCPKKKSPKSDGFENSFPPKAIHRMDDGKYSTRAIPNFQTKLLQTEVFSPCIFSYFPMISGCTAQARVFGHPWAPYDYRCLFCISKCLELDRKKKQSLGCFPILFRNILDCVFLKRRKICIDLYDTIDL